MNNVVNSNAAQSLAQVFSGKNGPIFGGIIGIVTLVGMYYVIDGNYKFSRETEHGGFTFEPAGNQTTIQEEVEKTVNTEEAESDE